MTPTPPLRKRIGWLATAGLAIGLVRLVLEFVAPAQSMYFGVYYLMPVLLVAVGVTQFWGDITWKVMFGSILALCLIVWGIPNTLSYTIGQFQEWTHGRFAEGRAAPIAESAAAKIGLGVMQGALTSLAGTVWCTVAGTLAIWLPAHLRRKRAAA